ncbi:MAG: GNAT family N-acetyltransferase [Clostridia bacterium]|nr:GNAT family N-acetyltransferase [Clostridia bacterium]
MLFETERLIVRKLSLSDAEDIFEFAVDPDTGPRAGWQPHKDIEETKSLINMWIDRYDQDIEQRNFAIILKSNNKMIGSIGIMDLIKRNKDDIQTKIVKDNFDGNSVYEIGYVVSKKYWGKGIMTEATKGMMKYLFEEVGVDAIAIRHYEENIGSGKVQDKCGFKIIGNYQDDKPFFGTNNHNHIVRLMTKDEWKETQLEI